MLRLTTVFQEVLCVFFLLNWTRLLGHAVCLVLEDHGDHVLVCALVLLEPLRGSPFYQGWHTKNIYVYIAGGLRCTLWKIGPKTTWAWKG